MTHKVVWNHFVASKREKNTFVQVQTLRQELVRLWSSQTVPAARSSPPADLLPSTRRAHSCDKSLTDAAKMTQEHQKCVHQHVKLIAVAVW